MPGHKRLSRRRVKEIVSLSRRKGRDTCLESIAEGVRLVEAALEAGVVQEIVVAEGATAILESVATRSADPERIFVTSDAEFARVSNVEQSQGILAVFSIRREGLEHLGDGARVIVMDGVQDPGNVGSILRTSAWFGVDAVLAGPGCADFFNPKVVRSSMGGLWSLRVGFETDLAAALKSLSGRGYRLYGADADGGAAKDWRPEGKSVLVVGSEARGISEEVKPHLHGTVAIPGSAGAGVESLNVGVALGVLLDRWRAADNANRARD